MSLSIKIEMLNEYRGREGEGGEQNGRKEGWKVWRE